MASTHSASAAEADRCDDCGVPMPLDGSQLCHACEEADRRRFQCPVCGHEPVMYLVAESRPDFCSNACEARWWET